jgi:hypothetical protein
MQDGEDEKMFCLINLFYIYQKMSSKHEDIFLKNYGKISLKLETRRGRERERERETMMIACFDKQNH